MACIPEQALQRGQNHDYTLKVFPQAGHMLNLISQPGTGMSIEEAGYLLHNFHFAPGFLELMSRWNWERVGEPRKWSMSIRRGILNYPLYWASMLATIR